jgi:hypothetical protein
MRIRFWASALLLAVGLSVWAQEPVELASGKPLTFSGAGARTVFSIPKAAGGTWRLWVDRDATVAEGVNPTSVKLVAEIPGSALILVDTYPSHPGAMSYCQAGEEAFLRVVAISGKRPVETYRTKLESCADNIELATPGLKWTPESRTLDIHWLSAPGNAGQPANRTLKLGRDGKAD